MTNQVKTIGCANLKTLVESDKLIIGDEWTIYELSRFASDGKRYRAEEGHDDLVMCLVSFSWLLEQTAVKNLIDSDLRIEMVDAQRKVMEETYRPIGFVNDGLDLEDANAILNGGLSDQQGDQILNEWEKMKAQETKILAEIEREKSRKKQENNWLIR